MSMHFKDDSFRVTRPPDKDRKIVSVPMSPRLKRQVERAAKKCDVDQTEFIRQALEHALKNLVTDDEPETPYDCNNDPDFPYQCQQCYEEGTYQIGEKCPT